jgi:hypothetical protein
VNPGRTGGLEGKRRTMSRVHPLTCLARLLCAAMSCGQSPRAFSLGTSQWVSREYTQGTVDRLLARYRLGHAKDINDDDGHVVATTVGEGGFHQFLHGVLRCGCGSHEVLDAHIGELLGQSV